jgi:predicted transcriptional regulator of viral defense system
VRSADAYGDLLRMDRKIVTTREATARWKAEARTARRQLRALEEAGLVRRLRQGLWAVDPDIDPFVVPPFLTAPFPAYVSLWSALSRHGMIEQIPGRITVASLDRARQITTTVGAYAVHHLAPEVFGGYGGSEATGYLATAEKALFDTVYLRAAAGSRAYFPELTLVRDFDEARLDEWTGHIPSRRLRTLTSRGLAEALESASPDDSS